MYVVNVMPIFLLNSPNSLKNKSLHCVVSLKVFSLENYLWLPITENIFSSIFLWYSSGEKYLFSMKVFKILLAGAKLFIFQQHNITYLQEKLSTVENLTVFKAKANKHFSKAAWSQHF